jgi:hypothetical protein
MSSYRGNQKLATDAREAVGNKRPMHSDKTSLRPPAVSFGNDIVPSAQFTDVIAKLPFFLAVHGIRSARMAWFDA